MIWNEFWDNTRICRLSHLAHPALGILNSCVAPIICHFILAICGAHRKRWKTRWVSCFHLESIMKYVMYFMQRNYAICSTDLHHYFLWKWTKFSWKLLKKSHVFCERSELRLHFEWTKVNLNAKNGPFWQFFENLKQCYQTSHDKWAKNWEVGLRHFE